MENLKLWLLLLIIFCSWPAQACDVNLFAIISGVSKHDAFSAGMSTLGVAIKDLGDNYTNSREGDKKLHELMNLWVNFSSSFGQFPPEWAKADPDWQAKFADLGNIIGEIRRSLTADKDKAHINMLKFSRRLPQLYAFMPMDRQAKALLELTACFDQLWEAFYAQNPDKLKIHANDLKQKCQQFEKAAAAEHHKDLKLLTEYAEQIRIMSTQINAFKTVTLQMVLVTAEGQFVLINERISKASAGNSAKE